MLREPVVDISVSSNEDVNRRMNSAAPTESVRGDAGSWVAANRIVRDAIVFTQTTPESSRKHPQAVRGVAYSRGND